MKKGCALALLAVPLACSGRTDQGTGPSASRVVLSGTMSAAANGVAIRNGLVQIVDGADAGRQTFSNDIGRYELADMTPGTVTLLFSSSEFVDQRRTEMVRANATLNVQLEKKGFVLSGATTTQWGEFIGDVGVEASQDGRVRGGGGNGMTGGYRIPTLSPGDYIVRATKWGYVTVQKPVTITGDTTLDFVLDRVRVSISGTVSEAAPCSGPIQDARVEIVSGPDVGLGASSTATGYQIRNANWGKFWLRASKPGYRLAEVSMDVSSPGSKEGPQELPASSNVQMHFVLQRTVGC